jgi:hypothetical protein
MVCIRHKIRKIQVIVWFFVNFGNKFERKSKSKCEFSSKSESELIYKYKAIATNKGIKYIPDFISFKGKNGIDNIKNERNENIIYEKFIEKLIYNILCFYN